MIRGETEKIIQLNTEFHDILYQSSNSRKLYNMINNLRDYFYRYRVAILGVNGMPQRSLRDHKKILMAMKKGLGLGGGKIGKGTHPEG